MTKTYCDRCGKDMTGDKNEVWNPSPYKALKHDVCSACFKAVLDAFATVMRNA